MFLTPADLAPFATIDAVKAAAMIADAEAMATLVAPCLSTLNTAPVDETADQLAVRTGKIAAVKAVLRRAILRWVEAGTGGVQQQSTGPFSTTITTQQSRSLFWPSEVEQLQGVCATGGQGQAFAIDTAPDYTLASHSSYCALVFGALYCSCGADIATVAIYEPDVY